MRAEVQLASKTQAGHRHQVEGLGNEDAAWVTDEHPAFDAILMVADGMGGHPRPGEASEAAVHTARSILENAGADLDVGSIMGQALERAQAAVRKLRTQPTGKPPGTTLSMAVVCRGSLHIVHVGDGSVFLMREGAVRVLAGGERRRAGNRPDQFLGQPEALEPERVNLQLAPGDRLLLCTDGLTRYFTEAGMAGLAEVLGRASTPVSTIAAQLTAHSRPAGYDDDTTVALAEVTGFREKAAAPPRARREEPHMNALPDKRPGPLAWAVPLLAGGALLAGGFLAGRATARAPETASPTSTPRRQPATPEQLSALPPGNLI